MHKTTKFWVILFSALIVVSCGAFLLLRSLGSVGTVAEIYQNGILVETIDLDAVVIAYDFDVEYNGGYNTVRVEHGRICVSAADCPDKLCVNQGTIDNSAVAIVCLPHRLVIKIAEAD